MLADRRLAVAKRALAAANRPKGLNDALTGADGSVSRTRCDCGNPLKSALARCFRLGEVRRLARQVRRAARAGIAA